jgi:hypothetical protein
MPSRPVGVTDAAPVAATVVEVETVERASPDLKTTLTADPGSGGATIAITAGFADASGFKVRVENEVMLVTANGNTTTATVTRGQDGTTAVAHGIGVVVSRVVAVQRVSPIDERQITYLGRAATFRIPGRAGTTGQKLFAIHNATASKVLVDVEKIAVDLVATVIKAVTVLPPVIRAWKFTAVPTNGSAVTKVPEDSALTSDASVTLWQDASVDGTSSGTALTITLPANTVVTEEFAPRLITAVGYEMFDRTIFFESDSEVVTLRPLEGLCVFADYVLATQNPVTDMWLVAARWTEYTTP